MTYLEEFVADLERTESENDMHFSIYYIPPEFQPTENSSYD